MIGRQGGAAGRRRSLQPRLVAVLAGWTAIAGLALARDDPPPPKDRADPVAAEIELNRGILDFEQGRYREALDRLETADPAGAGASYYRGLSLLALHRAREALRQFEAVGRRPGAPAEAALDLGVAQLGAGDAAGAETTLRKYLAARPDDPYGHYFLGVALFRRKDYRAALVQLEAAAADTTLAPYLDFYRGLSAYAQGNTRFGQYLDQYRAAGDTGPAADLARRLSPSPARPGPASAAGRPADAASSPDRRWNFSILTGYEYDTNVALAPSIIGLGGGAGKADSRWVVASFGEYRLVQRPDWVLGIIGSTYDGLQFRQEAFNVQDYMGGAYTNVALGDFILGGRYEFHETLLDDKQFATDHRITPNLSYREGGFGHTTTYYEFEHLDVEGLALVPAEIRSGDIHAVGLTQAVYLFQGAGRLYAGYRFEQAFTRGSDFDRQTNMITGRIEVPLPRQVVADAEVRQFWDDYEHPNSLDFSNRPRVDRRIELRAGLQKFFTPHLSLRLDYLYTADDSNVTNLFGSSIYSFRRHVFSTLLIYDF